MAVLPLTLVPDAFYSGTLVTTTTVGNLTDGSDATYIESNSGNGVDGQWGYQLSVTPGDFASMTDYTITLRAMLSATGDDTWNLRAYLVDAAGTAFGTLPAYQQVSTTTASAFTFTGPLPAVNSKVTWDDARLIIDFQNIKSKGADNNTVRIAAASIPGSYNQATAYARTGADSALAADALTASRSLGRVTSDSVPTTEAAHRASVYRRRLTSDVAAAVDSVIKANLLSRLAADILATSDQTLQGRVLVRSGADGSGVMGTSATRSADYSRSSEDFLSISDAVTRSGAFTTYATADDAAPARNNIVPEGKTPRKVVYRRSNPRRPR